MEPNPYEYNNYKHFNPLPQQSQGFVGENAGAPTSSQHSTNPPDQRSVQAQKARTPERMPKARAQALARRFKRWVAVASIVGFGTLSGVIAYHQLSTTTATTQTSASASSTTTPATVTPSATASSSSQDSNSNSSGILQQGGNNFGQNGSSSSAVTGSSVS
jgi:hypothetical protein